MRLSKEGEQMYATGAHFSFPSEKLRAMLTLAVSDESLWMHKDMKEFTSSFLLLSLLSICITKQMLTSAIWAVPLYFLKAI